MKSFIFRLIALCSALSACLLFVIGCSSDGPPQPPPPKPIKLVFDIDPQRMAEIGYQKDIQPLMNARCISCHACYDAPGQLKLTSAEGLRRGASKQRVYDVGLKDRKMTRLFEDAHTEEQWRKKGFFSVLTDTNATTVAERLDSSVLYQMLAMARLRRLPEKGLLDGIVRDSHDIPQAPTIEEFPNYVRNFPHAGMPFYTYGLTDEEFSTFAHWIAKGAPIKDDDMSLTEEEQAQVTKWETLLNGESIKDQTIARYLYEHWFAAALYFDDSGKRPNFFRVVRSSTPPGEAVDLIATRRPNDPPKVPRVYYRIIKRPEEIMRKNHLPYVLNDWRYERLKDLFWETDWTIDKRPPYGRKWVERPFEVFAAIPERSRYKFMLDDSFYYVQAYIRGPVCRGQVALSVIWDHFFVYFMDPDYDPSVAVPGYADETRELLVLPSSIKGVDDLLFGYPAVKKRLKKYHEVQRQTFNKIFAPHEGLSEKAIWTGEKDGDVPFMTVYRHFDTASVVKGFEGETPEYGWFVNYDLLERIYYLLVVNFDVFGAGTHQIATRQYFDMLRYEGEMNYLRLFPAETRGAM